MAVPERVLNDPRLVTAEIGGHEYKFWLSRRSYRIAEVRYGYRPEDGVEDGQSETLATLEAILRMLWLASLLFEEQSFDDFQDGFVPADYAPLTDAYKDVLTRQSAPQPDSGSKKKSPKN